MAKPLADLAPDVAVQCPKATDVLISGALSDAARIFMRESKIKRVSLAAIPVVAAQAEYTLPNPADHQISDVRWATLQGSPLRGYSEEQLDLEWAELRAQNTVAVYRQNYYEGVDNIDWRAQTSDYPNAYYCPDPNTMRLVGIPTSALSPGIIANVAVYPTDPTEVDDWIYNEYQDGIVFLALNQLFLMPQKAWTNPNLAGFYKGEYETIRDEAAARANRGNRRNDQPLRVRTYAR